MEHLQEPITRKELKKAVNELKNDKSPGLNGIPGEAFKAMNKANLQKVFDFITDFWGGEVGYEEWHEGQGVPVPKIPDPENPNKYRIVNLMDVCSEILSKILTNRAYQILQRHGTKYQFGATPEMGCQDGAFVQKSLLHLRRQHNLDTFVVFADLVKAFDTSNHELMIEISEKYDAPPKFCNAIQRLYDNLKVVLKIGKEKAEIAQGVGVLQGDNLSPLTFLFLMTAFAETLEEEWTAAGLPRTSLMRVTMDDLEDFEKGQFTGHSRSSLSSEGTFNVTQQILYVDDGAFFFPCMENMAKAKGLQIIHTTFARLGLEMHIGRGKTE
ncbi:hypothetical protein ACHAWF_001608 [Thalassiosira exigua]